MTTPRSHRQHGKHAATRHTGPTSILTTALHTAGHLARGTYPAPTTLPDPYEQAYQLAKPGGTLYVNTDPPKPPLWYRVATFGAQLVILTVTAAATTLTLIGLAWTIQAMWEALP